MMSLIICLFLSKFAFRGYFQSFLGLVKNTVKNETLHALNEQASPGPLDTEKF